MIKLRAGIILLIIIFLFACQPARRSVSVALLGDLMVGRGVHPSAASLTYLAPQLKAADLSLANLESPLAPGDGAPIPSENGYNLCTPASHAAFLPAWGLDILSLANNHRFDCGPSGVASSQQALTALGLTPLVSGPAPVYRTINGLKLAWLAFDDILTPVDPGAAVRAIQSARSSGAMVVVLMHWGMEYQSGATARQKTLANQFAAAGAALIVGTHPHVLQPAAWIPTDRGKTLVLYSLGNALFDQAGLPDTRQSALVLVSLTAAGVQSTQVVPFEIDPAGSRVHAADSQTAAHIRLSLGLP
jgi:poly-gamma-glutamate capsule biosynthesis protein CapA/YwtB (metallophosphatase superfamily)